jgi:MFS family permease
MSTGFSHLSNPPVLHGPSIVNGESSQPLSMAAVLRIPMMRHLWYAQVISVFGDFVALYAVISILTFKLHATAQHVNGVQLAYLVPIAMLGVIAGVFVDRWPLKLTMVSSDAIRAGLVLLLLAATQLWHFYLALAAISILSSFFGPAQGVAIRWAVPLRGLGSANALMQQVTFGMRIFGPACAVFLVETIGAASCYLLDSVSYIASACLIASVAFIHPGDPAPGMPAPATTPRARTLERVWNDMEQGFSFIFHDGELLFVIIALAAGMFVIGCFAPLTAVYVRDTLHAPTRIFGVASGLVGVGMVVGINSLAVFASKVKKSLLVYAGLAGIAIGLLVLAALAQIWSAFVAEFIIGFAFAAIFIPAQTMIQQETPTSLLGRVGSTVASAIFTAQIAGLILSGILAERLGVRQVFAICALLLGLLIAAGLVCMRPKRPVGREG